VVSSRTVSSAAVSEFPTALRRYLAAVTAVGLAVLVALVVDAGAGVVQHSTAPLVLLALLVVLGEIYPIKLPGGEGEFTTSTTFAFAVLLVGGAAPAAVALAFGSLVTDALRQRSIWRAVFNAAQYTLAMAAAGLVVTSLTSLPDGTDGFAPGDLPAILLGAATFFALNNSLAGTASALAIEEPILRMLRADLVKQAWTAAMLLGLAPVVVITANFSVLLLPWLMLPIFAVYRGGQAALFQHQATHDALTGLPAAGALRDVAAESLRAATRTGAPFAVIMLDLDSFKRVNDTLGHHRGDRVLKLVAPRLTEAVGDAGTVARLGGDEFAVVLAGADAVAAIEVANAIERALSDPLDVEGLELKVGASLGVACHPDHGDEVDVLFERADAALYVAKRNRSGVALWAPGYEVTHPDMLGIALELSRALDQQEIVVHYQPKLALGDGRVTGVEALVRWMHPERGMLPPDSFIQNAEKTGLMRRLTVYVLDVALRDRTVWASRGVELGIAVNVSVSLLDRDLPAELSRLLERWDCEPGLVTLEITESTVMADPVLATRVLEQLEALGVRLSIDDFGTGYSSLAYLKSLPVGEIKIDKAFVRTMMDEPSDAMIVRSTVDLGHNLGLDVVAEGVEDEATWNALRNFGCDYAQGYWMSRPVPADEIVAFDRERWPRMQALAADAEVQLAR
jgi:diguanylate cyclase (GGDEF)-like protein